MRRTGIIMTVPSFTVGLVRINPKTPFYFLHWPDGSFMLGLWKVCVFLNVETKGELK